MTEEERQHGREEYAGKSASQLAKELLRLLLVLIWKFTLWLIKKFLKGILWCIEATEKGWKRLDAWWHDNDTQEKVAKIKAWTRKALKTLARWSIAAGKATMKGLAIAAAATWHGTIIALRATWRGLIVGGKATVKGIFHLRSTLKRIGRLTVKGAKAVWAWMKRCRRGMKLARIKRKRSYEEFRRRGGVKGLIIDTSHSIKNGIQMFMEEDQEEAAPDAVTEDDIMEEALEEGANEGRKSIQIGRTILSHAKSFMDVE